MRLKEHSFTNRYFKYFFIFAFSVFTCFSSIAQPDWKLVKDKNGIKVFTAANDESKFKSIRVQCVFDGTIDKLVNILSNISEQSKWVYKTKKAVLLKQLSPTEYIYYAACDLPWPVNDRDGVYHLKINHNAAGNVLRVSAFSEPDYIAKSQGMVRVPYTKASWLVTELQNQISIDYTFEVDPGGSIPSWMVNMFADKGPYETFRKLGELLKS